MLSFRLKGRWTPPSQHSWSTEWSLHCLMLSLRLKGRGTQPINTVRAQMISSLFNVVIETQRQMDPTSTLSEHRVISSLFNVVILTQRKMDPHSQHSRRTEWSLQHSMLSLRLKARWTSPSQHCQSTEWSLHCSMLSFRLKGRWTPLVNIVRAQSYLFTVQCCHSVSKADGPPSQLCQSTEWSLHCSMLSFRLKVWWTPLVNIVRAQSYLFTVQCCHSDSKADGPPQSTLSEHRVISSLFNVANETERQMDPPKHCQSTEWSLHCSMLSFRLKGRWTPPGQHCQSTELSLHRSMLSFRLKGRWTTPINTVRTQSDLFTVQCCKWDWKTDGPPKSTLSEHRMISSLFNVVIQTQRQVDPPRGQHCQSTEWSLHCSMLSFRHNMSRWSPPMLSFNSVRTQSDLFTVKCCHSDSKADGPPINTFRA